MKKGDSVIALMDMDRVGLKKDMTGKIMSIFDKYNGEREATILWDNLNGYPDGVVHSAHHFDFIWAFRND